MEHGLALCDSGKDIDERLLQHLSPLGWEHINLTGDNMGYCAQFRSLNYSIDTGTPSGRFFFNVMASLAEMERDLIVELTRAGLEVARQLGRKGGRKPKMTGSKFESAKKLLASGVPPK